MSEPSRKDILYKYLLAGLLFGGGTAMTSALVRNHRLNKKLEEYENQIPKSNEDTMVVPVSDSKRASDMSGVYKNTAFVSAGALSYLALASIFRRIEDNRMRKIEAEAYRRASNAVVGDDSEKKAQVDTVAGVLKNFTELRNLAAAITFLGTAAYIKKKLDRENVDSAKLKVPSVSTISFNDVSRSKRRAKRDIEAAQPAVSEAFDFEDYGKAASAPAPKLLTSPVTGVDPNGKSYNSVVSLRRMFEENPEAADAFVGRILDASGHENVKMLQKIPVVRDVVNNQVLGRVGMGTSYRGGWDPKSQENSLGRPKKLPDWVKTPEDRENYGLAQARGEILKNKALSNQLAEIAGSRAKHFKGIKTWWLKRHPEMLLDKLNLGAPAAKLYG